MLYPESEKVVALKRRVESFMDRHVYPNEERFYKEAEELGPWKVYPVVEELKPKARSEGLWNLFLPESDHGAGLTNFDQPSGTQGIKRPKRSCDRCRQQKSCAGSKRRSKEGAGLN
jgi:alkylation response protein AidB-like acyl-CoA dehydrogenase